ncbi:hypothetical protein B0H34DRAFT_342872 [Crassisporium funariophilum]|nr:hypothetical protein B0H34DRAFT_342872 [Crassisporium funariophilum]
MILKYLSPQDGVSLSGNHCRTSPQLQHTLHLCECRETMYAIAVALGRTSDLQECSRRRIASGNRCCTSPQLQHTSNLPECSRRRIELPQLLSHLTDQECPRRCIAFRQPLSYLSPTTTYFTTSVNALRRRIAFRRFLQHLQLATHLPECPETMYRFPAIHATVTTRLTPL